MITASTNCGEFDRKRLEKLKHAYAKAVREKKETFWFSLSAGGVAVRHKLLCSYVKYLIEYLETTLPI